MNWKSLVAILIVVLTGWRATARGGDAASTPLPAAKQELANDAYRLVVRCTKDGVLVQLHDRQMGLSLAEGSISIEPNAATAGKLTACCGLQNAAAEIVGRRLTIRGKLAGLDVEHSFDLPADRPIMEERIAVHNPHRRAGCSSSNLEMAASCSPIADEDGKVLPELDHDRFVAVPFRAKPDDAQAVL